MMKAKMKLRTTLRNPISDKKHRKPLLNSGTSEAAQGPFTSLEKQGVVAFKKESHAMVLLHRHTQWAQTCFKKWHRKNAWKTGNTIVFLTTSNWSWRCNDIIIITVFLIWLCYLWLRCYILDFLLLFHSTAQGQDPMVQCSIQLPCILRACLHFLIFRNKKKVHGTITQNADDIIHTSHAKFHNILFSFLIKCFSYWSEWAVVHSRTLDIENSGGKSIFVCLVPTFSG